MDGWLAAWTIDSLDETRRRCFCSLQNSDKRFTHFAKLFTGKRPSREYDAFCRAATIGLTAHHQSIAAPVGGRLDTELPMIVYDRIEAMTLHEWLNLDAAPQPMFRRLNIARAIVDSLQHIHRMGYIHGSVSTDHVLVRPDDQIVLTGWGDCEAVGAVRPALNQHVHSMHQRTAPERSGVTQASSCEDIFNLAFLLSELLGQAFLASPIANTLLSDEPSLRPTSCEIAELLAHFQAALSVSQRHSESAPMAA